MNWRLLLIVFSINLVYIMLNTLRTILVIRGYMKIAPFIAMVETAIYTIGLSLVMQYLDQWQYLLFYALGFGVGIYLGILLEDRIALGYVVIQLYTINTNTQLATILREHGYGVTSQMGQGKDSERLILTILTPRSHEVRLCRLIDQVDSDAFYISTDAKYIHGGYWTKRVNPFKK